MKRTVLTGLVALGMTGCATDESRQAQVPAAPTAHKATATPPTSTATPPPPTDAAPQQKQTPDSRPKSASATPQELAGVPTIQPSPVKKETTPTTKVPSPAVAVRVAAPETPTDSQDAVPTLTLVHAANLQGEIEPCG